MDEESRENHLSGQLPDACRQLQEENARLKALLAANDISWEEPLLSSKPLYETPSTVNVERSAAEKITLFSRLFRGRTDVYPVRWESAKGLSGYSPACSNEWRKGVCNKPRIKCGDCEQRLLLPVTENVLYRHLTGKHTIGVYPMLPDETCYFIATDFDDEPFPICVTRFLNVAPV